jgi:hypothetical protein
MSNVTNIAPRRPRFGLRAVLVGVFEGADRLHADGRRFWNARITS